MSAQVLEELTSEEFAIRLAFLSTPSAMRACLRKSSEVARVIQALQQGAVTEEGIRRFVSRLFEDLRAGERFPHEVAIAALAVALENRATHLAETYLHDLARLQLAELGLAIRVARECLKRRVIIADRREKTLDLLAVPEQVASPVVVSQPTLGENGFDSTKTEVNWCADA